MGQIIVDLTQIRHLKVNYSVNNNNIRTYHGNAKDKVLFQTRLEKIVLIKSIKLMYVIRVRED